MDDGVDDHDEEAKEKEEEEKEKEEDEDSAIGKERIHQKVGKERIGKDSISIQKVVKVIIQ